MMEHLTMVLRQEPIIMIMVIVKYFEYMAEKNPDVNFKFVVPRDIGIIYINSTMLFGVFYDTLS